MLKAIEAVRSKARKLNEVVSYFKIRVNPGKYDLECMFCCESFTKSRLVSYGFSVCHVRSGPTNCAVHAIKITIFVISTHKHYLYFSVYLFSVLCFVFVVNFSS